MPLIVRPLTAADSDASDQLGYEAFGFRPTPAGGPGPEAPPAFPRPGATPFGAFDGDRLVAKAVDRSYDGWFGGRLVPVSGLAGVTVAAEERGGGGLEAVLPATLAAARMRGAAVSTLMATAPRIYRRYGYEVITDYLTVELSPRVLASTPAPVNDVVTRRATEADAPAVHAAYDAFAARHCGPLSRRGPSFTASDADLIAGFTGVTITEEQGRVTGYALWNRGHGFGEQAVITVSDLVAHTAASHQALLRMFGTFATVARAIHLETSEGDLARTFLPTIDWTVVARVPYMLTVLDVPAALSARGYPPIAADLTFRVVDERRPDLDGDYRLTIEDGVGDCRRLSTLGDVPVFTARGLALLYGGARGTGEARAAGLLSGAGVQDGLWDALFLASRPAIRDFF